MWAGELVDPGSGGLASLAASVDTSAKIYFDQLGTIPPCVCGCRCEIVCQLNVDNQSYAQRGCVGCPS